MKKEIIKFCVISIAILLALDVNSQTKIDLAKNNCFTATVKYQIEGEQQEGLLLFVNYNDPEMAALHYTNVFLLGKNGQNLQIAADSNAFISVYDVKVSENSKYLALMMVGEGHPWIEIYDLPKLISERKQELLANINPYPGSVNMIDWQKNNLIVESDMNLLLKNDNKELSDTDLFENFKKFSFSLDNKKFKTVK